ncbi:uncharacterized protein SAPINGB_P002856 [Magnusiomyces paraingens]|uniref:aspartyl aminopeptidase n=1 Tax=Magnusiomyces paraingens TaxID=2606893 RepID=A0A5E8BMH9_9ASCO|nr:uncharacterized protein SAPINGB_P002856 [Saprochaete ingens]VVT50715.1 unnamed protein product [Saprochaete ingens]
MSSKLYANEFLNFVNASPSPYHAVQTAKTLLTAAGFVEISERVDWANQVERGKKYFLTRNGSSIVAFGVGGQWSPGNGISIIGAHTDSPVLRVKPNSKRTAAGYKQVGVETYGGGLWHTWFDRDLSLAGRVLVRHPETGDFIPKLIQIKKPILRIPTLAIHLNRGSADKFEFNKEKELFPILGLIEKELNKGTEVSTASDKTEPEEAEFDPLGKIEDRHEKTLLDLIAAEAETKIEDIEDFELVLYDTQPSVLGGINDEFIFSPRHDNLNSSFTSLAALIESINSESSLENDEGIRMVTLFDHEEIGSASAQGADSNLLLAVLSRLASLPIAGSSKEPTASSPYETFSKSFLISADMAHAVHPNYQAKHESKHEPQMNKGPVIKINANQRYATNSPGVVLVKQAAKIAKTPLQLFVVRNDSACGSTIGPILASKLGILTLDIGSPQLSMHSIRETAGTHDIEYSISLFKSFYENYSTLQSKFKIDGPQL